MDRYSWHCTGGRGQDYSQEEEMEKGKMVIWEGLIYSCEKKRPKEQRRKGKIYPLECRVPKNSKLLLLLSHFSRDWLYATPCDLHGQQPMKLLCPQDSLGKNTGVGCHCLLQRRARRDKKAFLGDQCKETEENNRMGKTRDLFKEIRDTKGTFHAKMCTIRTEMVWT